MKVSVSSHSRSTLPAFAIEVLLGDALSSGALEVGESIDPEHSSVLDGLVPLEVEQSLSPLGQLALQLDDG